MSDVGWYIVGAGFVFGVVFVIHCQMNDDAEPDYSFRNLVHIVLGGVAGSIFFLVVIVILKAIGKTL